MEIMTIKDLEAAIEQWKKESLLGENTPVRMRIPHEWDRDYDYGRVWMEYEKGYRHIAIDDLNR